MYLSFIEESKKKQYETAVLHLFYTDLPQNDWNSTKNTLQQLGDIVPTHKLCLTSPEDVAAHVHLHLQNHPHPHLHPRPALFMCGRSFYEQVLPTASVHIGYSGTAMHWVSQAPHTGSGFFFGGDAYFRAKPRHDAERLQWENMAAHDWRENLRQ